MVRTATKNIDHQRTLVLYIYAKESVLAGNHTPRWTMFQQKGGYITLCTDDKGTRWQQSMFENLGKDYFFRDKCSFYSQAGSRDIVIPKSKKDLKASACFSWIYCGNSKGKMN